MQMLTTINNNAGTAAQVDPNKTEKNQSASQVNIPTIYCSLNQH